MPHTHQLSKIKKYALLLDWEHAFGGKSKGNNHIIRIVKIAKFLSKHENVNEFIVIAGAWLHDAPLSDGSDYNYSHNKKMAHNMLTQFELTSRERNDIAECIAAHEGTITPKNQEAKIVHDADVLEKSGLLGVIRHTWKLVHLKKISSTHITDIVVKKILSHIQWRGRQLQTPVARKISSSVSFNDTPKNIKYLIKKIATLAEQNIITEDIAFRLRNDLTEKQWLALQSQLTLSYLRYFKKAQKKSLER